MNGCCFVLFGSKPIDWLKNRRAMDHVLGRLVQSKAPFAVMNIDLDYFKAVNDTMGHAAGDFVLQHVARILVEETREREESAS